jgi:hypothetical protein
MSNEEKRRRINQAINETVNLLEKAKKKHSDSLICLKMEVEENRMFGNDIESNMHAVIHCNKLRARVKELEKHIEYLNNMLAECGN